MHKWLIYAAVPMAVLMQKGWSEIKMKLGIFVLLYFKMHAYVEKIMAIFHGIKLICLCKYWSAYSLQMRHTFVKLKK